MEGVIPGWGRKWVSQAPKSKAKKEVDDRIDQPPGLGAMHGRLDLASFRQGQLLWQ